MKYFSSPVGIEQIGFYVPSYCMPAVLLAERRRQNPEKIRLGLGIESFSVPLPFEDAVTLAANAAEHLFSAGDVARKDISRVAVATESSMDNSKPVAAWLHGMLGLREDCEAFDVKFACVGGMYALLDALRFSAAGGGKVLVVTTDISLYGPVGSAEFTQGAGAVALVVSDRPDVLSLDVDPTGTYTRDESDFYRPFGRMEAVVHGAYSVECYLRSLRAIQDYQRKAGMEHLFEGPRALSSLIFHTPYPRLPLKALAQVLRWNPVPSEVEEHLLGVLGVARRAGSRIGNPYTAAVLFALCGVIDGMGESLVGSRVGIFTYGSGSGAKFVVGTMGEKVAKLSHVISRYVELFSLYPLSVEEYEALLLRREMPWSAPPVPFRGWKLANVDSMGYRTYEKER
jgi:hydroxymethylglutaryl-CoA synthase